MLVGTMDNNTTTAFQSTKNTSHAGSPEFGPGWVWAGIGLYVPLTMAIVVGNLLVIGAFFTTAKLKTKTNYFIVSLAIADMLVGMFSVPMWVYFLISRDFLNPMYAYFQSGDMVAGVSSIVHLTCISLERCYAIVAPLRHRRIRKESLYCGIALSWTLALCSVLLRRLTDWPSVSIFNSFAFFFTPLLIIIGAYLVIFLMARKSHRGNTRQQALKKDLHVAYTVAMVTGLFVLCWLPFFLVTLLFKLCLDCRSFVWDMRVLMTIKMLHYGNSVLNPIIYAVRNQRFNRAFRRILRHLFCCDKTKEVEGQSLTFAGNKSTKSTKSTKSKRKRDLTIL